jgi:hypothetical protein
MDYITAIATLRELLNGSISGQEEKEILAEISILESLLGISMYGSYFGL